MVSYQIDYWKKDPKLEEERNAIFTGMVPYNKFDLRLRTFKDERFLPIYVGILPDNLFSPKSRVINCLQCFKKEGIIPYRLLLFKCKDLSKVGNEFGQSGTSPIK